MIPKPKTDVSETPPNPGLETRRRIKKMDVMVADVVRETPDGATLILFTGNEEIGAPKGRSTEKTSAKTLT